MSATPPAPKPSPLHRKPGSLLWPSKPRGKRANGIAVGLPHAPTTREGTPLWYREKTETWWL